MTAETELCSLRELYVLDGLTASERAAFLQHLQACATCLAQVAALQDVAEHLLYDFEDVTPPSGMRARVLDALFADDAPVGDYALAPDSTATTRLLQTEEPTLDQAVSPAVQSTTTVTHQTDGWTATRKAAHTKQRKRPLWPALAGVITAASLAWAITLQLSQPHVPTPVGQVVQSATLSPQTVMASARAQVWVNQATNGKNMYLQFSGLQPVRGSQVYQIWLVRVAKGGLQVYSAGVFKPSANGDAVFTFALPHTHYSIVAVTLEPKAIDKTPLGPKVLVGQMNV